MIIYILLCMSLHRLSSQIVWRRSLEPRLSTDGVAAGKPRPRTPDLWYSLQTFGDGCAGMKKIVRHQEIKISKVWTTSCCPTSICRKLRETCPLTVLHPSKEFWGIEPSQTSWLDLRSCECLDVRASRNPRLVPTLVCNVTLLEGAVETRTSNQQLDVGECHLRCSCCRCCCCCCCWL